MLLPHVGDWVLPTIFSAQAAGGSWVEFPLERGPIVADAIALATEMDRVDPRGTFSQVAKRSSLVVAVDKALNAGESMDGAKLSGPALVGRK